VSDGPPTPGQALYGPRVRCEDDDVTTRPIAATVVAAIVLTLLAGCAHGPSDADLKSACEHEVGKAVVDEWRANYGDAPWDVIEVASTAVKKGAESNAEVSVFYVSGTASVRPDHRNKVTEPVRWSCFSQYRADDRKVHAAIRSVSFR
jgi:hypothetical protein